MERVENGRVRAGTRILTGVLDAVVEGQVLRFQGHCVATADKIPCRFGEGVVTTCQ